jgi:hypothetical protein
VEGLPNLTAEEPIGDSGEGGVEEDVGTRILIFFALNPKLVRKTGNLRFGNNKIRETG